MAEASELLDVEAYLAKHEQKELVRFVTVGSVDDGKSTLIGRLLHDTQAVYDDQLAQVEAASKKALKEEIDFSLITDGLKAEREQGITIDVAYRYFSTETRKFILADTPGHEQYTRNMATGASTADIAIILLDARLGVLPQSRRHAAITSLLGIPQLIVAVNKMDLVDYAEDRFEQLRESFGRFVEGLRFANVTFIPVSAKKGDNVTSASPKTPWYSGPTLLGLLSTLPVLHTERETAPFRFPVQLVLRPHLDYRGFAGTIVSGEVSVGDEIVVLPSKRTSRIAAIDTQDGSYSRADAPRSVVLRLTDEVDISRGDMIAKRDALPDETTDFEATIVWMSERAFDGARKLLLKHTTRLVPVRISALVGLVSLDDLALGDASAIALNDIARVRLQTTRPIFCDTYEDNRETGSFILIDALDNRTVAAGMIVNPRAGRSAARGAPTARERSLRLGFLPALVRVSGHVEQVERAVFDAGLTTSVVDGRKGAEACVLAKALAEAGLCVLVFGIDEAVFASLSASLSDEVRSYDLSDASPDDIAELLGRELARGELLREGGGI